MEKIKIKLSEDNNYFVQEAYKTLRTNLQFCGKDIKVIAVTSCKENEGKTTVSLNLAKCFAELGKKVLLIDADMRKSVMAGRNTDAKNVSGLSELLTGMEEVDSCIYKTQYSNMDIVFAGKYPPNPAELLGGKYFHVFLEEAREIYDYVIIDTPPLGLVIDAALIAALCDGTVLVISNKKISSSLAQSVTEQLQKSGSRILGVVRNNTKIKRGTYYYKRYGTEY